MKLSKRERMLISILIVLLLAVLGYLLVLTPLQNGVADKQQKLEELTLQQEMMRGILDTPGLEDAYRTQKQLADDNYDSFYATLNSYTIDNILRGLLDANGLTVKRLGISPYEPVELPEETAKTEDSSSKSAQELLGEQQGLLLKSTVEIEASGKYFSVLAFIDAMNEKSFCLQVSQFDLRFGTEKNLITDEAEFTCTVDIFGIDTPEGLAPV